MGIPKKYVNETCRIGQLDKCCRYLTCSADGFCCEKHSSLKELLDKRANEKSMTARADNCKGWDTEKNLHLIAEV